MYACVEITDFMRANPQVLILLIICLVLGIGTFVIVLFGVATSGSTQTNGYPSDAIFGTTSAALVSRVRGASNAREPLTRGTSYAAPVARA